MKPIELHAGGRLGALHIGYRKSSPPAPGAVGGTSSIFRIQVATIVEAVGFTYGNEFIRRRDTRAIIPSVGTRLANPMGDMRGRTVGRNYIVYDGCNCSSRERIV